MLKFPDEPIRDLPKGTKNPLVRLYGPGPDGSICGDCTHLYYREYARRYYKCDLRVETAGPGSDHRVRWQACARFDPIDKPTGP